MTAPQTPLRPGGAAPAGGARPQQGAAALAELLDRSDLAVA